MKARHPMLRTIAAITTALAIAAFSLFAGGCSAEPADSVIPTFITDVYTAYNSYIYQDALGRRVTIPGDIHSIAATDFASAVLIIAAGMRDNLVATGAFCESNTLFQRMGIPSSDPLKTMDGNAVNPQTIIALQPELVILSTENQKELGPLENAGLNVGILDNSTFEGFCQALCALLPMDKSRPLTRDTVDIYYTAESALSQEKPCRVYLPSPENPLMTSDQPLMRDLVRVAGGRDVAEAIPAGTAVTAEQLAKWDPDYILLPEDAAYTKEDLLSDNRMAQLSAVREGHVLQLPAVLWSDGSYSVLLGMQIEWLAMHLHPDRYPPQMVFTEIQDFFQRRFQLDISLEDLQ